MTIMSAARLPPRRVGLFIQPSEPKPKWLVQQPSASTSNPFSN
ncbi:hypothetical protein ACFLUS_00730 [Chloroflexota bacterium]